MDEPYDWRDPLTFPPAPLWGWLVRVIWCFVWNVSTTTGWRAVIMKYMFTAQCNGDGIMTALMFKLVSYKLHFHQAFVCHGTKTSQGKIQADCGFSQSRQFISTLTSTGLHCLCEHVSIPTLAFSTKPDRAASFVQKTLSSMTCTPVSVKNPVSQCSSEWGSDFGHRTSKHPWTRYWNQIAPVGCSVCEWLSIETSGVLWIALHLNSKRCIAPDEQVC